MAFGQASGPPASAKLIQELAELLEARGFDSFKEARHPFGLTQRQAGGKFTVDEANQLIEQLGSDDEADAGPGAGAPAAVSSSGSARGRAAAAVGATAPASRRADSDRVAARALRRQEDAVVELLSEVMATELTNRGWCCIPPTDDASS